MAFDPKTIIASDIIRQNVDEVCAAYEQGVKDGVINATGARALNYTSTSEKLGYVKGFNRGLELRTISGVTERYYIVPGDFEHVDAQLE